MQKLDTIFTYVTTPYQTNLESWLDFTIPDLILEILVYQVREMALRDL